jgi:hypothetical protein
LTNFKKIHPAPFFSFASAKVKREQKSQHRYIVSGNFVVSKREKGSWMS